MKTLAIQTFSSLMITCLLISCGAESEKEKGLSSQGKERENLAPDGSNIDGLYKATFTTLNPHVNGTIPGGVTIQRKGDRLFAYVRLFAGGPKVWHQQNIYMGERCPTLNDDLNKDGFIDILEAKQVLGPIIVPLDADVSSQSSGRRFFPVSDLSGSYSYERVTSFSRFFNDLQNEDRDIEDDVTKIGPNAGFSFSGKVVMIQGVAETVPLPESVATFGKNKAFKTLPIVCGIISSTDGSAGVAMTEGIPGPVAPVIDGQDTPAPEGAGEYYPPKPEPEHDSNTNTNHDGETSSGTEHPNNRT